MRLATKTRVLKRLRSAVQAVPGAPHCLDDIAHAGCIKFSSEATNRMLDGRRSNFVAAHLVEQRFATEYARWCFQENGQQDDILGR